MLARSSNNQCGFHVPPHYAIVTFLIIQFFLSLSLCHAEAPIVSILPNACIRLASITTWYHRISIVVQCVVSVHRPGDIKLSSMESNIAFVCMWGGSCKINWIFALRHYAKSQRGTVGSQSLTISLAPWIPYTNTWISPPHRCVWACRWCPPRSLRLRMGLPCRLRGR